jgi:hypothetical protein
MLQSQSQADQQPMLKIGPGTRAKVVLFGIKLKLMKWTFVLTYFYDLLTYLKTVRAKVVMFGIKPKLMKWTFELTYFYNLLTYLKTIRAKVVMFGIKLKLMKCRFDLLKDC